MSKTIPSPSGYPLLGNVLEIDPENPTQSLARLAAIHGPIFRLRLPAERILVGNYACAEGLFDEKRFQKAVTGPLEQVRNAAHDGLFTAYPDEPNWAIAHRTLMPAFGPLPIRSMFGEMQDIASQMVLKWARFGPEHPIDASGDFTRLTLDSIALCAMGTRFNSFYHDDMHPFVDAMVGTLSQSFIRSRRPPMTSFLFRKQDERYNLDIELMKNTSKQLLADRRKHPVEKQDLLNAMINNVDSKTGQKLDDDSIINNMITFLIAGHETTSGMLSFLFYELLESPEAYSKAEEEVNRVCGKDAITVDHMGQLPYLEGCLKETLRLHPTAPAFTVEAKSDQDLNGYAIKKGEQIVIMLARLHRDPDVYGADAESFRPSRMMGESLEKLPANAWKPFGNGVRGCIGRPFAWQEALLTVATLLQVFKFSKHQPNYNLKIKTALTIKPADFFIRATVKDPDFLEQAGVGFTKADMKSGQETSQKAGEPVDDKNWTNFTVVYGTNTGTCEALAQALVDAAPDNGFRATAHTMDSIAGTLPISPLVIITPSYEGEPPDNGAHFVEWLKSADIEQLKPASYAVFGVGNKQWRATYQKIPTLVNDTFKAAGAKQLTKRYAADVAEGNIFDSFDAWLHDDFWPALRQATGQKTDPGAGSSGVKELKITIDTNLRSEHLRSDVRLGEVCDTRLLTSPGAPRKRHIAIRLPTGTEYRAGDYLAVLPINPPEVVRRVMTRYKMPWDAVMKIDPSISTALPTNVSLPVQSVLASMVELNLPATRRAITSVIESIPDFKLADELTQKSRDEEFLKSNPSLIDILEEYTSATFSLGQFLAIMPPMRLRQYSISSSPLADPNICTLTYSVVDAPSRSKANKYGHRFLGVATTYLERLSVGDQVHVGLRPSRAGFHLPNDDSKPIIMACAGTGLAPFYAFAAERAIKKAGGIKTGPALLFYGCNHPGEDDMYKEEFEKWEEQGVISVRRAYTHAPEASEGCKYVQDRIWHDRKDAIDFFKKDAELYICGAGYVGSGVEDAMARIRMEYKGVDRETADAWVKSTKGERFWADIFS
ncbi:putative P450 monooxygenase [Aureobasidium pullulans]|uniref:Bifunctional cytochrome P450/NADPH--P450 reductase n=1 Tax=Aureobasidium pullulans TaxID=5580 RepID=A0A4S9KSF5_AURPU|nr:putative P450 monooxygenase [Aureobasidium pullulans]